MTDFSFYTSDGEQVYQRTFNRDQLLDYIKSKLIDGKMYKKTDSDDELLHEFVKDWVDQYWVFVIGNQGLDYKTKYVGICNNNFEKGKVITDDMIEFRDHQDLNPYRPMNDFEADEYAQKNMDRYRKEGHTNDN